MLKFLLQFHHNHDSDEKYSQVHHQKDEETQTPVVAVEMRVTRTPHQHIIHNHTSFKQTLKSVQFDARRPSKCCLIKDFISFNFSLLVNTLSREIPHPHKEESFPSLSISSNSSYASSCSSVDGAMEGLEKGTTQTRESTLQQNGKWIEEYYNIITYLSS